MNQFSNIFLRLIIFYLNCRQTVFFYLNKSIIKATDMAYGNYHVVLKIVGLYMRSNEMTETLASLQVRIIQVQYQPCNPPCYFDVMVPMQNRSCLYQRR